LIRAIGLDHAPNHRCPRPDVGPQLVEFVAADDTLPRRHLVPAGHDHLIEARPAIGLLLLHVGHRPGAPQLHTVTIRAVPGNGSALVTAGDLVFWGDMDRRFRVFDADTGKIVWETILGGKSSRPARSPMR
jgi:PQQ enzyme-like repeat protein